MPKAKNNRKISSSKSKKEIQEFIESIVKIIGVFFAAITLFFTYLTYNSSQKWKVAEFTFSQYNLFSKNSSVIKANKMLDYNRSLISFSDSSFFVEDDLIDYSLRIDTINGEFKFPQSNIRDIFDEYLDQLSLFNRYAKADLISYEQIKPYLIYQISIIADSTNTRKTNTFRNRLWNYIDYYGYEDVQELCKNLGYNIKPVN